MDVEVIWIQDAVQSFRDILRFIREQAYGDADARGHEIREAARRLRYVPSRCPVLHICSGKHFRRLIVHGRFLVYYIYFPPQQPGRKGRVSIRAVKHSASKRPFAGVRESTVTYGVEIAFGGLS